MSTGTLRPARTTANYGWPIPGDADPADYVTDTGNLADAIDTSLADRLNWTPTWLPAALTNGWTNAAGFQPAGFLKDPLGFVYLRGMITGGAANTISFTLPAGYRPGMQIPLVTLANIATPAIAGLQIGSDGSVLMRGATGNVSLFVRPFLAEL